MMPSIGDKFRHRKSGSPGYPLGCEILDITSKGYKVRELYPKNKVKTGFYNAMDFSEKEPASHDNRILWIKEENMKSTTKLKLENLIRRLIIEESNTKKNIADFTTSERLLYNGFEMVRTDHIGYENGNWYNTGKYLNSVNNSAGNYFTNSDANDIVGYFNRKNLNPKVLYDWVSKNHYAGYKIMPFSDWLNSSVY